MTAIASQQLRMSLIDVINTNNNVSYSIKDIDTIRFTLHTISIWVYDGNRFDINYDIMNSIEIK